MKLNHFFKKKTAPGAVFFRGFSKFEKIHFFFEKLKIFQKFICFVYNEFLSEDINFFFQRKLRLHTFEWWRVCVSCTSRSSHLKLWSTFEKLKKSILSVDPKIVAFKLQMCWNSILTSEMESATHFWSRTTLVYVYHAYSDFCEEKTKKTTRALEWCSDP